LGDFDRASSLAGAVIEAGEQRGYSVKTVRELSVAGPCITLGLVLRESDWRISYRDRHGTPKFISRRWAVHTEPCPSCPDHSKTKYPDGYGD
jgi:hypothetical protein